MTHGLFVIHVLAQACTNTFEVGNVVTDFLDGLDLLLKVLSFQEIAELKQNKRFNIIIVVIGERKQNTLNIAREVITDKHLNVENRKTP